jgi:hypothetical protein
MKRFLFVRLVLDSQESAGQYASLTIGTDGLGLISYLESTGLMKVSHCSKTFCVPYFRRR